MSAPQRSGIIVQFARALAMSVKMAAVVGIAVPQTINVAYASKFDLPKPYVSRALDAVLIPINHASRHRYQIPPKLRGVYVLAVAPHGVAARQGIRLGDVLATVRHKPIVTPADVDQLVWAALAVSATSFLFGINRGTEVSDIVEVNTNITVNNFNTNISINNISQWTSVDSHEEWTQIVDEYDDDMEATLSDQSYRDDDDSQPGGDLSDTDEQSADDDSTDDQDGSDDSSADDDSSDDSGADDGTDDQGSADDDINDGDDADGQSEDDSTDDQDDNYDSDADDGSDGQDDDSGDDADYQGSDEGSDDGGSDDDDYN